MPVALAERLERRPLPQRLADVPLDDRVGIAVPVQPVGLVHHPERGEAHGRIGGDAVGPGKDQVADAVEGVDPPRARQRALVRVQHLQSRDEANPRLHQGECHLDLMQDAGPQWVGLAGEGSTERTSGIVAREQDGDQAIEVLLI